jgi:hypothetical protein
VTDKGLGAVFTSADLIDGNMGAIPTMPIFKRRDGNPMTVAPRWLLAHEMVRFVGETGAISGAPCVVNGVMDALGSLGIRNLEAPLTPLKVWQAIQAAQPA